MVQVASRSTHTLTVKSLSIDPEAIMFCCGWVCDKMTLSTAVITTRLYLTAYRDSHYNIYRNGARSANTNER